MIIPPSPYPNKAQTTKCEKCGSRGGHKIKYATSGRLFGIAGIELFDEWFSVKCGVCGYRWKDRENILDYETNGIFSYSKRHPLYQEDKK